jgi:hypothetical protein
MIAKERRRGCLVKCLTFFTHLRIFLCETIYIIRYIFIKLLLIY